jgi:hypothetical protein
MIGLGRWLPRDPPDFGIKYRITCCCVRVRIRLGGVGSLFLGGWGFREAVAPLEAEAHRGGPNGEEALRILIISNNFGIRNF